MSTAVRSSLPGLPIRSLCAVFGILIVAMSLSSGVARADFFQSTGSMPDPSRAGSFAVTLNDGKVLVGGGREANYDPLTDAALFDPSTGVFTPTGSMNLPRSYASAVLLESGEVLVIGGGDNANFPTAEIFDPATETFSSTGSMASGHQGGVAVRLGDGRVLVAGGSASSGFGTASAEIYDPATGTFSSTGSMSTVRRYSPASALLPDGKVLVAGGQTNVSDDNLASAEVFDPASGTFSPTGSMSEGRMLTAAVGVSLAGGKSRILVAGGRGSWTSPSDPFLASAEIYDPSTGTFSVTGSMSSPRIDFTATPLSGTDSQVLIAGGTADFADFDSPESYALASTEVYDADTGRFTAGPSMFQGRNQAAAAPLSRGRVLVVGGVVGFTPDDDDILTASAEVFVATPNVHFTRKPAKSVKKRVATFRFASSLKPSTFSCRLDGKRWSRCGTTKVIRHLTPGQHTFRVRASYFGRQGAIRSYSWKVRR